ncbi:hypothetical protein D3C87_1306970 [compost metagenome]
MFYNAKANSRTPKFTLHMIGPLFKRVKDLFLFIQWYAYPRIFNLEFNHNVIIMIRNCPDRNGNAALFSKFNGIGSEAQQNLGEPHRVPINRIGYIGMNGITQSNFL